MDKVALSGVPLKECSASGRRMSSGSRGECLVCLCLTVLFTVCSLLSLNGGSVLEASSVSLLALYMRAGIVLTPSIR